MKREQKKEEQNRTHVRFMPKKAEPNLCSRHPKIDYKNVSRLTKRKGDKSYE